MSEQLGRDEVVVHHDVRLPQQLKPSDGDQLGITRSGTDQVDHASSPHVHERYQISNNQRERIELDI
jgi:hypothetical protein